MSAPHAAAMSSESSSTRLPKPTSAAMIAAFQSTGAK